MTHTAIRLLHVEDDRIQQSLIARELTTLKDYRFEITVVASEDEVMSIFPGGFFGLVILDFHLTQGDGLSCLRYIRQLDPIVPVIVVSGVATHEIAAVLIAAGADDYLSKETLDSKILGQSVRNVLTRAQAFRARFVGVGA